ncbi:hypothetical protein D9756_009676 [Leucocoprinus leucothites]|uniref:Nephrocystin 3-like N-terminal domain-containing protein n=1 Tax=Leucocoprinus leucothites TaxID=201217 RepID=A0A8H5FTX3_9AGAR|nr:hypothetical protein D9756_009676 [Leucoagaricus leucothites]
MSEVYSHSINLNFDPTSFRRKYFRHDEHDRTTGDKKGKIRVVVRHFFPQPQLSIWRHDYQVLSALEQTMMPGISVSSLLPVLSACFPGTRVALSNEILSWFTSDNDSRASDILWLSGAAGSGKSTLAWTILERAKEFQMPYAAIFVRTETSGCNPRSLLIAIAHQLALEDVEYRQGIIRQVKKYYHLFVSDDIRDTFTALFILPFEETRRADCLVVLDGLNSTYHISLVRLLTSLLPAAHQSRRFLWFIATQPEPKFTKLLDNPERAVVRMTMPGKDETYRDVELYLRSCFQEMKNSYPVRATHPNYTQWPTSGEFSRILQATAGIFSYTEAFVTYLRNPSIANLIARLQCLIRFIDKPYDPTNLEEERIFGLWDSQYRTLVEDIPVELWKYALSILAISDTTYSLTPFELSIFLKLPQETINSILDRLYSVLYPSYTSDNSRNPVQLAHKPLIGFLKNTFRSGCPSFRKELIYEDITIACHSFLACRKEYHSSHPLLTALTPNTVCPIDYREAEHNIAIFCAMHFWELAISNVDLANPPSKTFDCACFRHLSGWIPVLPFLRFLFWYKTYTRPARMRTAPMSETDQHLLDAFAGVALPVEFDGLEPPDKVDLKEVPRFVLLGGGWESVVVAIITEDAVTLYTKEDLMRE